MDNPAFIDEHKSLLADAIAQLQKAIASIVHLNQQNEILLNGYARIKAMLLDRNPLDRTKVAAVIRETFDQFK